MNGLEDQLRDAYDAATQTVRPEDIGDLRRRVPPASSAVRWRHPLLTPLAAAAAVVVLILVVVALVPKHAAPGAEHGHRTLPSSSGHASGHRQAPAVASPLPLFTAVNNGDSLDIVKTTTGAVISTISPPQGQMFTAEAGTADDRTFVLAAQNIQNDIHDPRCQTWLYRFTLNDNGQPSTLTSLVKTPPPGTLPSAIAISADGRVAAYSSDQCATGSGTIPLSQTIGGIHLIGLATGQVSRVWTYSLGEDYPPDMSLSADGSQLAFTTFQGSQTQVARVLSTNAPSGTIDAASRVVLSVPESADSGLQAVAISPDASMLYACLNGPAPDGMTSLTLAGYSVADGHRTRVLQSSHLAADSTCTPTMDPSGGFLLDLVSVTVHDPATNGWMKSSYVTVVDLGSGKITRLPIKFTGDFTGSAQWQSLAW
ncbi:MAG TPA: hypothetical protein VF070_12755 [Streptosporangiaceae bacterium]